MPDRSSDEFEDLFENAPCGYLTTGDDGRISRINRTLAAWIGIDAASLIGRRFGDLLTIGGKIFYETHFAPMLRMQGSFSEVALDLVCADGRNMPMLVNAVEGRDNAGKVRFVRYTLFNASERRRYERNLLEAKAKAEAAVKLEHELAVLREQFMAVLGHDLRNPLASIAGGLRLLGKEPISERGQKLLALMNGSVTRAAALIENVLDLTRARLGGGIGLSIVRGKPLAPVIEHVVAELQSIAPERIIKCTIDITRDVHADHGRIGQLVSNLLGNAITHGSPDQPIHLRATVTHGDTFDLSVANGGAPILDEAMAHLFQPFFRGAIRKSANGLGLGLFIAAEIARAHGGTLDVISTARETRFTFRMPVEAEAGTDLGGQQISHPPP